jgi:hypothetical protein
MATNEKHVDVDDNHIVYYLRKEDPERSEMMISYFYEKGILRKGELFECSKWGIRLLPQNNTIDTTHTNAIHEAGHATPSQHSLWP